MSVDQLDVIGGVIAVGRAWPPPGPARGVTIGDIDPSLAYAGDGLIAGIAPGLLTVDGLPAARTIRVFDRGPAGDMTALGTGAMVRQLQSAPDGTYTVSNIDRGRKYTVMAVDDEGVHNAVVADLIVPVAMPG